MKQPQSNPAPQREIFTVAYKFYTLGYSVLPSGSGDTRKHPMVPWREYQDKQPTEAQLYEWEAKLRPTLYGLTTGDKAIVIDPDTPEWMKLLRDAGLEHHIRTPRGQGHFYVLKPPWKVTTRAPIRGLTGIDVRGDGGFVNFVGSIDGVGSYQVLKYPTPDNLIPFTSLPQVIQRGLEPDQEPSRGRKDNLSPLSAEDCEACAGKLDSLPCITYCKAHRVDLPETLWHFMVEEFVTFGEPGERKVHEASIGYQKGRGYSEQETQKKIEAAKAARRDNPELGPMLCGRWREAGFECPAECRAQVEKLGVGTPATLAIKLTLTYSRLPLNDMGNAHRLIRLFGGDLRYVLDMGQWLTWDGKRWQFDRGEQIGRVAKKVVRSLYTEAGDEEDEKLRDNLVRWASQSGYDQRIKGLVSQARWGEGITVMPDSLDANPWLLNVLNGTVNLTTGDLQRHRREDLITKIIPLNYNPDARSLLWETTLRQIFSGNDDLILYFQRACGYSATGCTQEMAAFFPQGAGFNGKSTVLGAIADILGPYAAAVDPAVFMLSKFDRRGPSEPIADLYRIRYALSSEIEMEMRLSVGLVKRITGGEQLRYERKYEHGFTFKPEFKLWLMSNHEPAIPDSTNSIWGRIKKIPFSHYFGPQERIPDLRQRLVAEHGEAILAWLVQGAIDWHGFGLSEPAAVTKATAEYRESQDVLHDFLAEKCDKKSSIATVLVADLYNAYVNWCEMNGDKRPLGKMRFGAALKERGFSTRQGTDNKTVWQGIKLL